MSFDFEKPSSDVPLPDALERYRASVQKFKAQGYFLRHHIGDLAHWDQAGAPFPPDKYFRVSSVDRDGIVAQMVEISAAEYDRQEIAECEKDMAASGQQLRVGQIVYKRGVRFKLTAVDPAGNRILAMEPTENRR
jgi:hypothetical protein